MNALPYAHGGPVLHAVLRQQPSDFVVDEDLGFEPVGEGEHAWLVVRKQSNNTEWVARQLAHFADVAPMAVGYAGLKDRHAITTQVFTVHLPGRESPDWSAMNLDGVDVISETRHDRKLRRGALRGNRFQITLRDVRGERAAAEQRLQALAQRGAPNYFGEQRFGRDGDNLEKARAMFAGARMPRHLRSVLTSAARSYLFNELLAQRVKDASWDQLLEGEVLSLNASHSWFVDDGADHSQRLADGDIHPSGVLWGRGRLPSTGEVGQMEQAVAEAHSALCEGLERAGLKQDRRALRVCASELTWAWLDDDSLRVSFGLPAGCYATALLRELARWEG